jgi:lipid-A-disaccharide synthase-like uncharacterized protein
MPSISFIINLFTEPLVLFGFFAQFIFFLRFVVQWIASEKKGESTIPVSFWYLSIFGSILIFIYALKRQDVVFVTASSLNTMIYIRNLQLIKKKKIID